MNRALDFVRANGGRIHRHPGGFWWRAKPDYRFDAFATTTINALERRGWLKFIEWRRGRSGEFPITAELVAGGTP